MPSVRAVARSAALPSAQAAGAVKITDAKSHRTRRAHIRPSLTQATRTMHHAIAVRRVVFFALILPCVACDAVLGLGKFTFDGSADASEECSGPSFDPARIAPFLTSDGSLPPLPPFEAGAEAAPSDAGGGG